MNKFLSLLLLSAVLGAHQATARVYKSQFFPYGLNHGDQQLTLGNDLYITHNLSQPITFFNLPHSSIFVNNDGTISFNGPVPEFTPTCGSATLPRPTIIPFWADINISPSYQLEQGPGVFYRETTDPVMLGHATTETLTAFPGLHTTLNIDRVFIVTWIDVAFYGADMCGNDTEVAKSKRNSFQAVIATEGSKSFIIFNYDEVTWTAGTDSGGNCTGLGGTPARAGFDAGDHLNIYNLPGSCSPEILNVVETTNVNQPGKWIFRVDQEHIEDPVPDPEPQPEVSEGPAQPLEPGTCDPENCHILGYCFQYAKCDHETRTYLSHHCSHGLYWNPHNNSLTTPEYEAVISHPGHGPVAAVGRSLVKATRQLDSGSHQYHYSPAELYHQYGDDSMTATPETAHSTEYHYSPAELYQIFGDDSMTATPDTTHSTESSGHHHPHETAHHYSPAELYQIFGDDSMTATPDTTHSTESSGHHHHPHETAHGDCDVWDNLSPEVQSVYLHDQQCFPKCYYAPIAQCENRYVYHPHNTDARHVEFLHCPVDTREGRNVPMVWVQEREACDFCYNAYTTSENGHVSPCCQNYFSGEVIEHSSEGYHHGSTDGYDHWSTISGGH